MTEPDDTCDVVGFWDFAHGPEFAPSRRTDPVPGDPRPVYRASIAELFDGSIPDWVNEDVGVVVDRLASAGATDRELRLRLDEIKRALERLFWPNGVRQSERNSLSGLVVGFLFGRASGSSICQAAEEFKARYDVPMTGRGLLKHYAALITLVEEEP